MKKFTVFILALIVLLPGCCDQLKKDAETLMNKQEKCQEGDECVLVDLYEVAGDDNCLGPFQCVRALNAKSLTSFKKEARDIADSFEKCNECTEADCMLYDSALFQAVCSLQTGRCEIESKEL